jgi:hypothetical protein
MTHSNLYNRDHEERFNSVNRYLHGIHKGETDPTFVLFSGEAYFQVNEYGSSQNNFPTLIHAVSLLGIKVNILRAKNETRITESNFFLRP